MGRLNPLQGFIPTPLGACFLQSFLIHRPLAAG